MSNIELLYDISLLETVMAEPGLYKKAGLEQDILSELSAYFKSKIDPAHKTESIIDLLAPGVIFLSLKAMGLGKIGSLISLVLSMYHVDVSSLYSSIFNELKPSIASGNKVSYSQINSAVNSAAQSALSAPPVSPAAQSAIQSILSAPTESPTAQQASDHKYSAAELMHEARLTSLAIADYEYQSLRLLKVATIPKFAVQGGKAEKVSLLARIFGIIFKVALASLGIAFAGDVANKVLGKPNSIDGNYQTKINPTETVPTQTKYKSKGTQPLPSSVNESNTPNNIENMLVQFTKDVYSGLDNKDDLIKSSQKFQGIKNQIVWYNHGNIGYSIIELPTYWQTKNQLVDNYIDEVAKLDNA